MISNNTNPSPSYIMSEVIMQTQQLNILPILTHFTQGISTAAVENYPKISY
jgi:hypothetical protein